MVAGGDAKYVMELGVEPGALCPEPLLKSALLTDSAIGSTHWLSLASGQVILLL